MLKKPEEECSCADFVSCVFCEDPHPGLPDLDRTAVELSLHHEAVSSRVCHRRRYRLRTREGFRLITTTLSDAKHASASGLGPLSGLKSVLGGWPVDTEMLDRYIGRFVLPGKESCRSRAKVSRLWADRNGLRKLNLLARAPAKFSFATGQSELLSEEKNLLPLVGLEYIDFRGSVRSRRAHHDPPECKPVVATRQQ